MNESDRMPNIDTFRPGRFCWFELSTTDQSAAKKFYGELFGWTANDLPLGQDIIYTMFQLRGRDVGACYTLMPDQQQQGVPPHWMTYVLVNDCDSCAEKAKRLGGTVLMPPTDIPDTGRFAVLQDFQQASFAIIKLFPMPHKS